MKRFAFWIIVAAYVAVPAGLLYFVGKPIAPPPLPVAKLAEKVEGRPYPFGTSVVSGVKLGAKNQIITLAQDGYQVKLASADEVAIFRKNPATYMAKITDAYKTARPCPLTVCPVMGDSLDADSFAFVYEGREFKFCCDACMDDFEKDPAKFLQIWDDAAAHKTADAKK